MGRGKLLSAVTRAKIEVLKAEGYSNRQIAIKVNRSPKVVNNFIKNPQEYGTNKSSPRNKKLSPRQERQIVELAKSGKMSSSQIVHKLELPVKKNAVNKVIRKSGQLKYVKRLKQPKLLQRHMEARLAFAENHVQWSTEWVRLIFSDEKKFNLDGPDGCQYYWHDLSKEKETFFSRQQGGGSLMVWAAFSASGKSEIKIVSGRMNSQKYTDLMGDTLIPFIEDKMPQDAIYQQDNAPIHVSRHSKAWFEEHNIELLGWPALSPDLNPIENLWGIMTRAVYPNGKQYDSVRELEVAIKTIWREIRLSTLESLVNSMPNRMIAVLENRGGKTKF